MGGPGGGPGGGFMRRFVDGFQPEFMRRDMPTIRDQLALESAQATLIETLLVDYDEAFTPASQAAQEKLREGMQSVMAGFFNPQMRERMEQTMAQVRADIEQLAAESGGEVDPEVRRQLMRERFSKITEDMIRDREKSGAQQESKEAIGRMIDTIEAWQAHRKQLRTDLLAGIRATLSESQSSRWEAFDRYMRRERTIPLGALSGERVNLFLVVDEADLPPEVMTQITPILDRYEAELDAALRARNDFLEASEIRFLRAAQAANTREVEETAKRSADLHKAIREINDRYRTEIVMALPEANRARVERAALVAGYERVYRATQAERAFEVALGMSDLSSDAKLAVENLQRQYASDVSTINERLITQVRKQEPLDLVDESSRLIAMVNGMPPMGPGFGGRFGGGPGGPGGGDALQEQYAKRGEISDAYMRRLRELLSPEQQAQLPARGNRGGRGQGAGGPAGMLGNGRIAEMPDALRETARRHDTNNDGVLDENERDAAIRAMRREFGGGRGESNMQ